MSRFVLLVVVAILGHGVHAECPFAKMPNAIEDACKYATENKFDPKEKTVVYKIKSDEKFVPPSCGIQLGPCNANTAFRSFDGSCNNLGVPTLGLPNSTYYRIQPAKYGDRIRTPRLANDGSALPSPRVVRTALFPTGTRPHTFLSLDVMIWGQFLAHDMSLLREPDFNVACCTADGKYVSGLSRFCYPIRVPPSDLTMGRAGIECVNFTRTVTDQDVGCAPTNLPAQQINAVTSYMDLSMVYGLNTEMANGLRTFSGGRMRTLIKNGRIYPPTFPNITALCFCSMPGDNVCYQTGDSRANQNPQLAILHIIFLREHNRLAARLAEMNWHWNDERIFQEARRILIAVYQRISYYEWLPLLLGRENMIMHDLIFPNTGYVEDYNSQTNPNVGQEHAHAAYRFFHTQIVGRTNMMSSMRTVVNTFQLGDNFHRPVLLEQGNNIETLTIGMTAQPCEADDQIHVEDINDRMFSCGRRFGLDLRAADFQRDRDHGLSYYNDYRRLCGLRVANTWEELVDIAPENIAILRTLYRSVHDLDLSVGGSLERFINGAESGPTFLCIMSDQFLRTRKGDRFWFEHRASGLREDQLAEVRKATIARLFCDNGDNIQQMQPRAFTVISGQNQLQSCSSIPSMDLSKWRESIFG